MTPVPHLGNTIEMNLMAEVWKRIDPEGVKAREPAPSPPSLLQELNWLGQSWRAQPGGENRKDLTGYRGPGPEQRF